MKMLDKMQRYTLHNGEHCPSAEGGWYKYDDVRKLARAVSEAFAVQDMNMETCRNNLNLLSKMLEEKQLEIKWLNSLIDAEEERKWRL